MRNDGVLDTLTSLLDADPDVADRDQIGADDPRATPRSAAGSTPPMCASPDASSNSRPKASPRTPGWRSPTKAGAPAKRPRPPRTAKRSVRSSRPSKTHSATGAASADHLDVLARLTRNLSDVERSDLHAVADDIIDSATTDYVSEFERKTRNIIDDIRNTHAPQDEAAELDRQRAESSIKSWVDKTSGMHKTLIECDPIRDTAVHAAIDAQLARLKQLPEYADTPFGSLQVDALVDAVSSDQPGQPRIPEVSMLIDQHSACHGRHADTICETSAGTPLPVSTVQRMCCDATIIGITLGANGEVLDVGREQRTATRAQRRALRAMYRSCAHPHCTVSFDRCRIHHIIPWAIDGNTDIDNLLPLCERHHHLVHEGNWKLSMTPDRIATWTRPDGTIWHTGPTINRTKRRQPATSTRRPTADPGDRVPTTQSLLATRRHETTPPPFHRHHRHPPLRGPLARPHRGGHDTRGWHTKRPPRDGGRTSCPPPRHEPASWRSPARTAARTWHRCGSISIAAPGRPART